MRFYSGQIVSAFLNDGSWYLEARDVSALRAALGDELLIPFAQLFIWTDRLTSIAQLMDLSNKHVAQKVATTRNNVTLVAYAIGALYEAARAIRDLRRAGVGGLIPHLQHWKDLDALRKRWWDALPLKDLRNQIAFHAEADKIRIGLDRAVRKRRRVPLVRGEGPKTVHCLHGLGGELILAGLRFTPRGLRRASEQIAVDHAALGDLVEHVFIAVMQAKGLMRPS
jgi:hypothetical protein